MPSEKQTPDAHVVFERLALRAPAAAKSLGISPRKLWSLTNAGEIPHVKLGRATVYPVRELQEWLTSKVGGNGKAK